MRDLYLDELRTTTCCCHNRNMSIEFMRMMENDVKIIKGVNGLFHDRN